MRKEDLQRIEEFDRQTGRVRLYRDELQSIIGCIAAVRTLQAEIKRLERVSKISGKSTWKKIKGGVQLLTKGLVEYSTHISTKQYDTVQSNKGYIQFTPVMGHPVYCMEPKDYYRLVMGTRYAVCSSCIACMTKGEWQKCELRKTLDCVPCKPGSHEHQQYDDGLCPYAMIDKHEWKEVYGDE